MSDVQRKIVSDAEKDQRLDRWFKNRYPDLPRSALQKLLRTGQVRVDGKRTKAGLRLKAGQEIRVPPIKTKLSMKEGIQRPVDEADAQLLRERMIHIDDNLIAIDKPAGLAVQGGSNTSRHLDGMLDALRFDAEERPKLVHRLDKDTSGVMVLARNSRAARELSRAFSSRDVRKVYWALVVGVPNLDKGRIDLPLIKGGGSGRERVSVDNNGKRAVTDFQIVNRAGSRLSWLAMWPRTGRTHQLRAHCAAIGTPILGDGKYGGKAAFIEGLPPVGRQLQLLAHEVVLPDLFGQGVVRIVAALPPHMNELWQMFGLELEVATRSLAEIN